MMSYTEKAKEKLIDSILENVEVDVDMDKLKELLNETITVEEK